MRKFKLGVMAPLEHGPEKELSLVSEFGLPTCQSQCWTPDLFTPEMADRLVAAADKYNVEVTTLWVGTPGPHIWDFLKGPISIGIVPPEFREMRMAVLRKGATFAAMIGVPSITTHVGFIPENMTNPLYLDVITALRDIVEYCQTLGLEFWFECSSL